MKSSAEKSSQVKIIDIFHPPVDLTNPTRGLFPFHLCCIRSEWNATQLSHLSRKICTLGIFPICKLCTTFKSDPHPSLFIPSNADMIIDYVPLCIIINSGKYDTSVGLSSLSRGLLGSRARLSFFAFCWSCRIISSVRSSYSHPDLLLITTTTTTPLFQITPVLNTGLSLSEPLQLYKGYNAI